MKSIKEQRRTLLRLRWQTSFIPFVRLFLGSFFTLWHANTLVILMVAKQTMKLWWCIVISLFSTRKKNQLVKICSMQFFMWHHVIKWHVLFHFYDASFITILLFNSNVWIQIFYGLKVQIRVKGEQFIENISEIDLVLQFYCSLVGFMQYPLKNLSFAHDF